MSGRTDSSAVFLALLELLAWDVDTPEATLREDAAATVLSHCLARQFAHECPRATPRSCCASEAFASVDAKAAPTRNRTRRGRAPEALVPEGFRRAGGVRAGPAPRRDRRRARTARGVAEWRLAFVGSIIHISNPATRRRATRGVFFYGARRTNNVYAPFFLLGSNAGTGVGFGPARRQVSTRSRSEASVSHAPNSGSATSSTNLDQRLASFERTRASRSRSSSARSRVVFCPCPLAPLAPSRSQSPCVP